MSTHAAQADWIIAETRRELAALLSIERDIQERLRLRLKIAKAVLRNMGEGRLFVRKPPDTPSRRYRVVEYVRRGER